MTKLGSNIHQRYASMKLTIAFLSLFLGGHIHNINAFGYLQGSETQYLSHFDAIDSRSYAAADDPAVAPPTLQQCKNAGKQLDENAKETILQGEVISALAVQQQCSLDSVCVLPEGSIFEMTDNVNVGALIIRGSLVWNDDTANGKELALCAGYVAVEGQGSFQMTLKQTNGWIYVKNNGATHAQLRTRAFGATGEARVEISGRSLERTWTLLAKPFEIGSNQIHLLHDPAGMGWRKGDRIAIAPTKDMSQGEAQTFRIVDFQANGVVILDGTANDYYKADFIVAPKHPSQTKSPVVAMMSAEVTNLSCNIVITGDDFEHIPCEHNLPEAVIGEQTSMEGCKCSGFRSKCTMGLHTVHMYPGGVTRIQNTRIEKCGQRGIDGKYCLHFHRMKECKDCLYQNNVVENGHQRGIIVHDTHLSTVDSNILYNIRGAGIYIEDGNEMWNKIQYNVIICPWIWTDEIMNGCTVPGTSNREGDTKLNQAGIYSLSSTNDLVGNRVVNSFNGMFFDSGASGRVNGRPICLSSAQIGRMEGNTFHSNGRFGFYIKGNNYPKITDRALDTEGMNEDLSYCNGFYDDNMYGEDRIHDRGIPVAHVDTFDYGNAFVGHYNAGDIQYHRHASINNLNLVYWKETKNFANGCASHIVDSYYANGNLALPDQSTFIIERTTFAQDVRLEANHHCNVGITGVLCMPQYILHEIQWQNANDRNWIWFQYFDTQGHGANQHHGGVFSLSPPDAQRAQEAEQGGAPLTNNIFPPGFVSLVSWKYTYLLSVPNNACVVSDSLGEVYGRCYDHGILCKVPLRALKIYSRGLNVGSAPKILLEAWFGSNSFDEQSNRQPDARQEISYNQIGHDGQTQKQGYSVPVIPGVNDHSYRISVAGWDGNVPKDWVIEFSDPVMGNRWETEYLKVNIQGRDCGGPNGVISSQHDRRFLWSGDSFMDEVAWGNHGACTDAPPMETFDCNGRMEVSSDSAGLLSATECPELCIDSPCDTRTSYCNCGTATCECKAGFSGPDCQIDVCSQTSCGVGVCTERYLGGSPRSVDISLHPCICEDGFCHQQAPNTQESIYSSGCECYSDNECVKFPGTCLDDGSCPEPSPVEDGTACDNGSDGLCLAGVCQEDPEPTIIDNFAEEVNNLIPDDTPIIFKPETPTTTFNKEETTSEPPEVPQPLPVNNVMVESMGPDNFVPIASEMEEDEAEDEQFALPLVEVTSTAAVESQSACQSYCQGEYPYGCAEHIEGKVSYRCHPRGDCYYADSFDETSPFDGFCQYKQVEMPIEPVHNVPVATSAQADPCAGYCTGKYPYGCSLSVPGKNIYQCHPNGGCFYTTHENEKIPEGFCKYLEL